MNAPDRIASLLQALAREITSATAGSDQGQFPILDLLGNVRDAAASELSLAELREASAGAWERMVQIVEAGRPFGTEELSWLQHLVPNLAKLAGKVEAVVDGWPPEPSPEASPARPQALPISIESNPEDQPLVLNVESDGDLLREFIAESREHLDNIEQGVLVLENRPNDAETLNTIFRAFHTFKGSAGFLNLLPINRLAHVLESLLDLARQGKLVIGSQVIDLILRGRDTLKKYLDAMASQVDGSQPPTAIHIPVSDLKQQVLLVIEKATARPGAVLDLPGSPPEAQAPTASPPRETGASIQNSSPPAVEPPPNQTGPVAANHADQGAMVKVDTIKLDSMLDLVGEMVIAQSLVAQDLSGLGGLGPQTARNMVQLGRITRELQRVSMSMRMLPIRGAFHKMARVVRDLSAKQQKKVQLQTSGEDTELDRGVVEELNDPLLHMIRNSIDHGIESSEIRASRGKPAIATIHLRAYHQGGNIVLEIADDGGGLNRDRILAKALERGLITPEAKFADEDVFRFIFAAGFSTAEKVTDISGRGVGLDVVRRNIERLRGCIDISSTPGKGAVFKITLPLTLAIIDGLIVKVGDERYIIPTLSVRESFRPKPEMISRVQGRAEVVNVRGRLLPLTRLYERFDVTPGSTDPSQSIVVVVQSGANSRCLLVDGLLNKQEVVIKNLNELMIHKNRALAGAAILGDGRVGLILDVNSLVHSDEHTLSRAA